MHATESERRIEDASDEYTREGGPVPENIRDWLAFAQVHATLALVEEQRTANLIAHLALVREPFSGPLAAMHVDMAKVTSVRLGMDVTR
ncbi:MAG: hypothetical protein ACOH10_11270 [Rhodoglobus sp.]